MTDCCQLMLTQHAQTRRLLEQLEGALSACVDGDRIQSLYLALTADLELHFALEEQGLFETVSQYRSMMLMEVEHDDLLDLHRELGEALKGLSENTQALEEAKAGFNTFKERLLAHMYEEEAGIFPMVLRWLEPEEQQKVLRRFSELQARYQKERPRLRRPTPGYDIETTRLFQAVERPIRYDTLYEREHTQVQHLALQAEQTLSTHWAGQHQCIVLIAGKVLLETQGATETLTPGACVQLESQRRFSIKALDESHLLIFKVWPHPHFTKA